jgi:hydroxycarboxylate dehydrogenase B
LQVAQHDAVRLEAGEAEALATALFVAAGATDENARAVAAHLVESERLGLSSHGLLRVPQYLAEIAAGEIDPAATPSLERRAAVDGNRSLGPVAAMFGADEAVRLASTEGVALVTVRRTAHAGRIGAYVERIARSGLLGVAFCSAPRSGHRVAPFGAIDGRISTNPIAYAVPTPADPIVADFSTSVVPEGVVRRLRELGLPAPEGALHDADGRPTDDPAALYAKPPGTILPLGGERFGHKGFALALLVEVLATLLAGDETDDASRYGNNLALLAVATDDGFRARAGRLADYVRSARPADAARPVLLPGDPERLRAQAGAALAVDRPTWEALVAAAQERGIEPPEPV